MIPSTAAAGVDSDGPAEACRNAPPALAIWRDAGPLRRGDAAWRYLARITGRPDSFDGFGALRGHAALPDPETATPRPALLGALHDHWGEHVATLVLWLACGEDRAWQPAPLLKPLRVIGPFAATSLRLWRTDAFPPLPRALAARDTVTLAWSMALGMRVAAVDRTARVLAFAGAAHLAELRLPDGVRAVQLLAHRRETAPIAAAIERAAARFRAEGRDVAIVDHRGVPVTFPHDAAAP